MRRLAAGPLEELEDLTRWRAVTIAQTLRRYGHESARGRELAELGYDAHELEELLARGCALELALRILHP